MPTNKAVAHLERRLKQLQAKGPMLTKAEEMELENMRIKADKLKEIYSAD